MPLNNVFVGLGRDVDRIVAPLSNTICATCSQFSPRLGSVVAVPGVVVHPVEGHSTGLYQSHTQETFCDGFRKHG